MTRFKDKIFLGEDSLILLKYSAFNIDKLMASL